MSPPPPPPPVHINWDRAHGGPPSRIHGWSNQVAGAILADPGLRHRGREETRDALEYQEDERRRIHELYGHEHRPWWRPRVHWRHHYRPHSHSHSHRGWRWPWRSHSHYDSGHSHTHYDTGHHQHEHSHDSGHHHGIHGIIPELEHHLEPRPWLWFDHRCHPCCHGQWNHFFGWLLNDNARMMAGKMEEDYARKERERERAHRRENQNREYRRLKTSWDRPYTL